MSIGGKVPDRISVTCCTAAIQQPRGLMCTGIFRKTFLLRYADRLWMYLQTTWNSIQRVAFVIAACLLITGIEISNESGFTRFEFKQLLFNYLQ